MNTEKITRSIAMSIEAARRQTALAIDEQGIQDDENARRLLVTQAAETSLSNGLSFVDKAALHHLRREDGTYTPWAEAELTEELVIDVAAAAIALLAGTQAIVMDEFASLEEAAQWIIAQTFEAMMSGLGEG